MLVTSKLPRFQSRGFSLVELMVTVGIVAILATIAIPSYMNNIRKSRRTEARTALLDLAAREERLYSTTNKYSNLLADLGYTTSTIGSGYYQVTVTAAGAAPQAFSIAATPVAGKGQDKDTQCASFAVDQTGAQSSVDSSSADSTATCWK